MVLIAGAPAVLVPGLVAGGPVVLVPGAGGPGAPCGRAGSPGSAPDISQAYSALSRSSS
ncbi:hypothetical protein ABT289_11070 [Streptomyces fimicarius]